MPVDYWFNGDFANTLSARPPYTYTSLDQMFTAALGARTTHAFVAPDQSLFIPTNLPIVQGEPFFGTKWAPVLYAYGLVKARPGSTFYATNEAEQRTYRGTLKDDGSLDHIEPFLERGGESLAVDKRGNVYIAAGQVYVYSPQGALLRTLTCPERPHDLLFGGPQTETRSTCSASTVSTRLTLGFRVQPLAVTSALCHRARNRTLHRVCSSSWFSEEPPHDVAASPTRPHREQGAPSPHQG